MADCLRRVSAALGRFRQTQSHPDFFGLCWWSIKSPKIGHRSRTVTILGLLGRLLHYVDARLQVWSSTHTDPGIIKSGSFRQPGWNKGCCSACRMESGFGRCSHSSRVAMPRVMGRNNRGFSLGCVQIHSSLENLKNYGVALNSRLSCAGLARVPSAIGGNSLSAATRL